MNESLITVRYVKAFYQLAEEVKIQDKVRNDIEFILNCINQSPEFQIFIDTPLLKVSEKLEFIDKLFHKQVDDLTLQFLSLLMRNKREMFLKSICHYYLHYYKKIIGLKEATIVTAIPLKPEHRKEIFEFITRKLKLKLELSEKVNTDIIGGFILQIEDQQINASLQHQLNKIKRELIHT